ncbi:MAG: glycerate kinase [Rhodothermales bacterium]
MNQLVEDAQAIFHAAVRSVQPDQLFQAGDPGDWLDRLLEAYRRVLVVGAGKASMAMAGAVEPILGSRLDQGVVVVPHGYRATLPETQRAPRQMQVVEAGHPVPDRAGVDAAERVLSLASSCAEEDLLLVLISGGGSALWPVFAGGLSLREVRETTQSLLRSGATIQQINTVRKHLSRIGGGHLAARAYPAMVLTLIISDVVGNDLSVIASGPTVPDRSTFEEAVGVLRIHQLWETIPQAVREHLDRGCRGEVPETPKPGDARLARVRTILLGNNAVALEAARVAAMRQGYEAHSIACDLVGEAREVGREVVQRACQTRSERPVCLLWSGETTVTVTGRGRGGRNQEVALAAALELEGKGRRIVVLSGGTDGIDGPTDAAGAWATPHTARRARADGLEPRTYLDDNDAYSFFDRYGGLLRTGPTHTNIMDVQIVLIAPA